MVMRCQVRRYIIVFCLVLFFAILDVQALTGVVNVNDSLTLRDAPTTNGGIVTRFYNATELDILNTNAGSGNGCSGNWYQVRYLDYTGYSCSDYIVLKSESNSGTGEDDSYSRDNYEKAPVSDGTIMCYEDTKSLSLRSSAGGDRTGYKVDCGEEVKLIDVVETPGNTCPYWYQVESGDKRGFVCGYYVHTIKLSKTANSYYENSTNQDTIESYQNHLKILGFPDSYHPYLLELHARHPEWNFVAEAIPLTYDEIIKGESYFGRNLLQGVSFDEGYRSTAASTYDILNNHFSEYSGEVGWYQASNEAIAYYMDPRNYLNDRYIFAFETLEFRDNQTPSIIMAFFQGKSLFNVPYQYYQKEVQGSNGFYSDSSTGDYAKDIVNASRDANVSAVHVSSRILQEVGGNGSASSNGGSFTYCGNTSSGYYNFFNIGATATSCSSAIASGLQYAKNQGWNTPYKSLHAGASLLGDAYIRINQDTIYYEKFDVSTTNGHFTHQYQQNLTAPISEGGVTYQGYVANLASYLKSGVTFVIPVYREMPRYAVRAPKLGNPNNYLKSLSVNGESVANFSYQTFHYNVSLNSKADEVMIQANPILDGVEIRGSGKVKITSETQDVAIDVVALNGKVRTYTIHFTKKDKTPTTIAEVMSHSGFKYNEDYIFGISVGLNVSTLIGNIRDFNDSVSVYITSKTGDVKTNDSFRTGDRVKIVASDGEAVYTAVIYGDIDGDGEISKRDLLQMQRQVFGYGTLTSVYKDAADVDKNGVVDKKDLLALQRDVFGYGSIEQ